MRIATTVAVDKNGKTKLVSGPEVDAALQRDNFNTASTSIVIVNSASSSSGIEMTAPSVTSDRNANSVPDISIHIPLVNREN